jgi:hypothetical protein
MDGIRRKEHDAAPCQIMTANEQRGKENKEDGLKKNEQQQW